MYVRLASKSDATILEGRYASKRECVASALKAGTPLTGLRLANEYLPHLSFVGQVMDFSQFPNTLFAECRFKDISMQNASLYQATAFNCDFRNVNLTGSNLEWFTMVGGNANGLILNGCHIDRFRMLDTYGEPDYRGAILDGEILTKAPLYLDGLRWPVCFTPQRMRIFCQSHTYAEWAAFNRREITEKVAEKGVWDWWVANRQFLKSIADQYLAEG